MLRKSTRTRDYNRWKSRQQEHGTASRLGGKVTKASGASYEKGDVRVRNVCRIESKITKHSSFRVTTEIIDKIENATFGADEIPVIEVGLQDGERSVYVVPQWALEMILGEQDG